MVMKIIEEYREKWKKSIAFLEKVGFEFTKEQDVAYRRFPGNSFFTPGYFNIPVKTKKGGLSYSLMEYHKIKTGYDFYRFVRNLTVLLTFTSESLFYDDFNILVHNLQRYAKESNPFWVRTDLACAIYILSEIKGVPKLDDDSVTEAIKYIANVFDLEILK